MRFLVLTVATGIVVWVAFAAARAISAAHLNRNFRAEAPASEGVSAVTSDAPTEALVCSPRAVTPQRIASARRPADFRRRTG
jgi:hypothetical protein